MAKGNDTFAIYAYERRPGSYDGKPSVIVDSTMDRWFDVEVPDKIWVTGARTLEGFAWRGACVPGTSRIFRFNRNEIKASPVWCRQFPGNFNDDDEPETAPDHEIDATTLSRISRKPPNESEVAALTQETESDERTAGMSRKRAIGFWHSSNPKPRANRLEPKPRI